MSLGVDIVPLKICPLDCIYCQLGRTTDKVAVRKNYAPVGEVVKQLIDRLGEGIKADFITVSSPVFFTTVSAHLKALIDRCQRFWVLKYERQEDVINKKRKGIFIGASGSGSRAIFDCPKKVILAFFDVLYVDYDKDFLYCNTDSRGDILDNREALEDIYEYGKNIEMKKVEKNEN